MDSVTGSSNTHGALLLGFLESLFVVPLFGVQAGCNSPMKNAPTDIHLRIVNSSSSTLRFLANGNNELSVDCVAVRIFDSQGNIITANSVDEQGFWSPSYLGSQLIHANQQYFTLKVQASSVLKVNLMDMLKGLPSAQTYRISATLGDKAVKIQFRIWAAEEAENGKQVHFYSDRVAVPNLSHNIPVHLSES